MPNLRLFFTLAMFLLIGAMTLAAEDPELTNEQKLEAIKKLGGQFQEPQPQHLMVSFPRDVQLTDQDLLLFRGNKGVRLHCLDGSHLSLRSRHEARLPPTPSHAHHNEA
jgi:hypothetical protein